MKDYEQNSVDFENQDALSLEELQKIYSLFYGDLNTSAPFLIKTQRMTNFAEVEI